MNAHALGIAVVALAGLIQLATDPRFTPTVLRNSLIASVAYLAYVAVAVWLLVQLMPLAHGPHKVDSMLVAFLGWIGLGVLALMRFAPRLREPPEFLMHFGIADVACLIVLAGGLAVGLGGF